MSEGKILDIRYQVQQAIEKDGKLLWANHPLPADPRKGIVHARARELVSELHAKGRLSIKVRVVKIIVYHDQDFDYYG